MSYQDSDFTTEVAMGRYGYYNYATIQNKFGFNPDVDSSNAELIAHQGGSIAIMTAADTLEVVSSSAEDNLAGSGAGLVLISGIDQNNNLIDEQVTLTGTTPVTTEKSYKGVNRVVVIFSGSNDANVGNIDVTDTGATVGIQARIPEGLSVTQQCFLHTPIGHNFLISWLMVNALKLSGGSSPRVVVKGYSYSRLTDTNYEILSLKIDTSVENTKQLQLAEPFIVGGREVLYFTASTDTNNTEVAMRFSGKLIKV